MFDPGDYQEPLEFTEQWSDIGRLVLQKIHLGSQVKAGEGGHPTFDEELQGEATHYLPRQAVLLLDSSTSQEVSSLNFPLCNFKSIALPFSFWNQTEQV